MKKNIWLAVVGAAALAGCQNEVMTQRSYVPAPGGEMESMAPVVDIAPGADQAPARTPVRTPAPAPAVEFPPMTATFSNTGITSAPVSAQGGEYVVRPGDTLGKIAAAHQIRLSELMKANSLTEKDARRLRIGRKLVIPGKGTSPVAAKKGAKAAKHENRVAGTRASIPAGEYTVKAGDTPERIARRAGVRLSELMRVNNLTERDARRLRIGQKLTIPGAGTETASTATATAAASDAVAAAPVAPAAPASADSLEASMEQAEIKDQGNAAPTTVETVAEGSAVVPDAPTAPVAVVETEVVEVTEEISLGDFAKKYNTTPEFLLKENSDITGDKLPKGALVFVPKK